MTYEEFCECVKERIQEIKGEGVKVVIRKVLKNNGQELRSLTIQYGGTEMVPSLYLEDFYRQYECGQSFDETLEKILTVYEECSWDDVMDFSFFRDYKTVEKRIVYKLINQKMNEKFLESVPWFPVLDLAMVFYCILPDEFQLKGAIPVDNRHLKFWNVTAKDLYEAAYINTPKLLPVTIEPIRRVLQRILENSDGLLESELQEELEDNVNCLEEDETGMYVLSNIEQCFGAVSILYPEVLKNFAKEKGRDLYILPSSVHEVLLIPEDNRFDSGEFGSLVRNVNETQLTLEERLSDNVYYYRSDSGKISIISKERE